MLIALPQIAVSVSSQDQLLDRALSILPNPTPDRLNIRLAQNRSRLELALFSAEGSLIGKQSSRGKTDLNTGGIPSGNGIFLPKGSEFPI